MEKSGNSDSNNNNSKDKSKTISSGIGSKSVRFQEEPIVQEVQPQSNIRNKQSPQIFNQSPQAYSDDTMRGYIKRILQQTYISLMMLVKTFKNLSVVHCSKISLLVLFVVPVFWEQNLINCIYFILFIVLSQVNQQSMIKLWNFTLVYNSLVLLVIYAVDILLPQNVEDSDQELLVLIGLTKQSTTQNLIYASKHPKLNQFLKYLPYYLLQIIVVTNSYIINSKRYKKYTDFYYEQTASYQQEQVDVQDQWKQMQLIEKESIISKSLLAGSENQSAHGIRRRGNNNLVRSGLADVQEEVGENQPLINNNSQDNQQRSQRNSVGEQDLQVQPGKVQNSGHDQEKMIKFLVNFDPITIFVLKNSMYILVLLMYYNIIILPISILNLIQLVLMILLAQKMFKVSQNLEMYHSQETLLRVTNIFSTIFLLIIYTISVFQYIFDIWEITKEDIQNSFDGTFGKVLQFLVDILIGQENAVLLPQRMLSLALIMSLTSMQLLAIKLSTLKQILHENDKSYDREQIGAKILQKSDDLENPKIKSPLWHQYYTYIRYVIYMAFPTSLVLIAATVPLRHPSVVSLCYTVTVIMVLLKQQNTYFRESYKVIGVITVVQILMMYTLVLINLDTEYIDQGSTQNNDFWDILMKLFGLEHFELNDKYFSELTPYFWILVCCIIQREVLKFRFMFKQTVSWAYIQGLVEEYTHFSAPQNTEQNSDNQSNSQREVPMSPQELKLRKEYLIMQKAIYEFEKPIRDCLYFQENYLHVAYFELGLVICNFMGLLTILYNLNITSLVFLYYFYKILSSNFYLSKFLHLRAKPDYESNQAKVASYIRNQILILSIFILQQSIVTLPTIVEDIEWPGYKSFVNEYLCWQFTSSSSQVLDECVDDWNQWLSFKGVTSEMVIFELFYVLVLILSLQYLNGEIELEEHLVVKEKPVTDDEDDFLNEAVFEKQLEEKGLIVFWKRVLFQGFPIFLIIYIFIVALTFSASYLTDIRSMIYLIFGFYLLLMYNKLIKTNRNLGVFKFIRFYNIYIVAIITVFQIPLFFCPLETESGDYQSTEQCAYELAKDDADYFSFYSNNIWMAVYVVLAQSIGLKKYDSIQFRVLLLVVFTEVMNQVFFHPYFQIYVLDHTRREKNMDGRLRAFIFVEKYHLNKLWAYKAIKEEISILHGRLVRITNQLRKQDVTKHLFDSESDMDDEDYQYDLNLDSTKQGAKNQELNKSQEKSQRSFFFGSSKPQLNDSITEKADRFLDKHTQQLEDLVLELLTQSVAAQNCQPVIQISLLKQAIKEAIINQTIPDSVLQANAKKLSDDFINQYVRQLIIKIEREAHFEDRVDLYHKDGIGLNFIDKLQGTDQADTLEVNRAATGDIRSVFDTKLMENQFGFYQDIILQSHLKDQVFKEKYNLQRYQEEDGVSLSEAQRIHQLQIEASQREQQIDALSRNSSSLQEEQAQDISAQSQEMRTDKKFVEQARLQLQSEIVVSQSQSLIQDKEDDGVDQLNQINKKFGVSDTYRDMFLELDQFKKIENESAFKKFDFYLRYYLWNSFSDRVLFYSIIEGSSLRINLKEISYINLICTSILSQSEQIVYLLVILNFILNPNILSLVLLFTVLLFAMLSEPSPSNKFWKYLMYYQLTVTFLKFFYQLPIFCASPPYALFNLSDECTQTEYPYEVLVTRIDYIIGVYKVSGVGSLKPDQSILYGMLMDILILLGLLLHKTYLIKIGRWSFVKNNNNIYKSVSYKKNLSLQTMREKLEKSAQEQYKELNVDPLPWYKRWYIYSQDAWKWTQDYYQKLLPNYMDVKQKNLDTRYNEENPYVLHEIQKVKPGKDYFFSTIVILFFIFLYTLLFYKTLWGDTELYSYQLDLNMFDSEQVLILFYTLMLMWIERMLYRARQTYRGGDNNDQKGTQQNTSKLQISKHALAIKLMFYVINVFVWHYYLGFNIPIKNSIQINDNFSLCFFYLLWVFYFIVSALQIKYGYPQAPYKQTFMRDTSKLYKYSYYVFIAIPFLWEMKVITDWTVTWTCLDLFQWFKLDDASNELYFNRFQTDTRKSRPEFKERTSLEKMGLGCCFAFGLILLLLLPIVLFSGINPIMEQNPIYGAKIYIDIELNGNGNAYQVFTTQAFDIETMTEEEFDEWTSLFVPLNQEIDEDVMQQMKFSPYSENEWTISPPSLDKFTSDFMSFADDPEAYVDFTSRWQFQRDFPVGSEMAQGYQTIRVPAYEFQAIVDLILLESIEDFNQTLSLTQQSESSSNQQPTSISALDLDLDELLEMQEQAQTVLDYYTDLIDTIESLQPKSALQLTQQSVSNDTDPEDGGLSLDIDDSDDGDSSNSTSGVSTGGVQTQDGLETVYQSVLVQGMFPKYLQLGSTTSTGTIQTQSLTDLNETTSVYFTLNRYDGNSGESSFYWTFQISEADLVGIYGGNETSDSDQQDSPLVMVVYNEEVMGSMLASSASSLSVIGLYVTLVYAIGSFLRIIFDRMSQRVIYEEMPNVEKLTQITEGVQIAQLEGNLVQEKRLYDLLIRIFRSPETLMKITGTHINYPKKFDNNGDEQQNEEALHYGSQDEDNGHTESPLLSSQNKEKSD